ncbi:MAG: hypothetical protein ACK4EX_02195 [Thermaurantimonas sp.]|uniref:hypothetical protein n=1 Tax=Thermaurantimonas sp. TaxID=2681568 RepID=UPI00391B1D0C
MKKIFLANFFLLLTISVTFSQVVTSEPLEIDPNKPVKLIVNLALLDQNLEYVQNLIQDANDGKDLYIWTWKPREHPPGHPYVNGTGSQPWKNSNEALKMTKESNLVYSFTFTPSLKDWYEVDAATCYKEDIHFLVKPKDGGGYGEPDRKSPDLILKVDPPATVIPPAFFFPSKPQKDDVIAINYDNAREDKPSMKNLDPDSVYMAVSVVDTGGTVYNLSTAFNAGNNPNMKLNYRGKGMFRKLIIPNEFIEQNKPANFPPNAVIRSMKIVIVKQRFLTGLDRSNYEIDIKFDCD